MKPIKLSMVAFGPYKEKEIIDFRKLNDNHLYVISGKTGAGKTTIFDAICFALYGVASGSDRDNVMMLRSHFADDESHTSVNLHFKINEKEYRVLRQIGHIKEGNRTKTGDNIEFYEIKDEKEISAVDRHIVSEVNAKIESIIGLSYDQFKQIVMLPQGEFRRLLTSSTENKENILRKLFNTERFTKMNDRLKQKRDELKAVLAQDEQLVTHYISNIKEQIDERDESDLFNVLQRETYQLKQLLQPLKDEVNYYDEKVKAEQKKFNDIQTKHDFEQRLLYEAIQVNEQFSQLENKEKELKQLQGQSEQIKQKETELHLARQAQLIESYEKNVQDRKKELNQAEHAYNKALDEAEQAEEQYKMTNIAYEKEKKNEKHRSKLDRELEQYKTYVPIVKEMDQTRKQLINLKKSTEIKEKQAIELAKKTNDLTKRQHVVQLNIKQLETGISKLSSYHAKIIEQRYFYKLLRDTDDLINKEKIAKVKYDQANAKLRETNKNYDDLVDVWMHNQALILAEQLKNGASCPVCGSTHHPNKAVATEKTVTRAQLDEAKMVAEQVRTAADQASKQYNIIAAQLEDKVTQLKEKNLELVDVKEEKERVTVEGIKLKEKVDKLEQNQTDLQKARKEFENLSETLLRLQENKENIDKQWQEEQLKYTQIEATFNERIVNIPKKVQNMIALEEKINYITKEKETLEQRWETIQKKFQFAKDKKSTSKANVENCKKHLKKSKEIIKQAEEEFTKKLNKGNFATFDKYERAKRSETIQAQLQTQIEKYNQVLRVTTQQIEELRRVLQSKKRVNVKEMEEKLADLKKVYNDTLNQLNDSKATYRFIKDVTTHLENIYERIGDNEVKLGIVIELHDMIRGQNSRRLSLERYLQIDFLEQIMESANLRFRELTNGQYYLLRSDRQESHGRQSGLGIDVYDYNTAQVRDVKTLSGGEKFIASLCLALGMSDVIQSYQGSVSIETMFIDEGFGSLDDESLHKSIDALIELQQTGRTIGVISHVEELKSIFPAMLEVIKTREGYSKTSFKVK